MPIKNEIVEIKINNPVFNKFILPENKFAMLNNIPNERPVNAKAVDSNFNASNFAKIKPQGKPKIPIRLPL